jgi:type I restriction enzyme, S subunit
MSRRTVQLGEVAVIDRNAASGTDCQALPYVGLEHIEKDCGNFTNDFRRKAETLLATKFKFTSQHVLYGKLRPYLNKVVLPDFDGVCTTEILPLLPKDSALERGFLYGLLLSPGFVNWASQRVSGANLPRLDPGLLEEFTFELPCLSEQKRIAGQLEQADRLRRTRRYALELSGTVLPAAFLELFGNPMRSENRWNPIAWGDLVSISSGHAFKLAEYSASGVRLLQIANVTFGEIDWSVTACVPETYLESCSKLVLRPGDLVMALNRPILGRKVKFAVLKREDCPSILYQRVGRFTLKGEKIIQPFLCGLMLTDFFLHELSKRLTGSDQPYINPTELNSICVPLPPLSLQRKFAALMEQVEHLCSVQRESLRQAEHLFQSLLHQSFDSTP